MVLHGKNLLYRTTNNFLLCCNIRNYGKSYITVIVILVLVIFSKLKFRKSKNLSIICQVLGRGRGGGRSLAIWRGSSVSDYPLSDTLDETLLGYHVQMQCAN